MRKVSIIIALLLSVAASAQNSGKGFTSASEYSVGGSMSSDGFILSTYSVSLGYRFNDVLSVYVPFGLASTVESTDLGRSGSFNGTVGAGLGARFGLMGNYAGELCLQASTTVVSDDPGFLCGGARLRFGSGKSRGYSPYLSIGLDYWQRRKGDSCNRLVPSIGWGFKF